MPNVELQMRLLHLAWTIHTDEQFTNGQMFVLICEVGHYLAPAIRNKDSEKYRIHRIDCGGILKVCYG